MATGNNMKINIQLVTDDGKQYEGSAELVHVGKASPPGKTKMQVVPEAPSKNSCPGVLETLWTQGLFKIANSKGEVVAAMDKLGYSFSPNAVTNALSRVHFLTKYGSPGSYKWKQKHPAS
jgi:hypothetical protein